MPRGFDKRGNGRAQGDRGAKNTRRRVGEPRCHAPMTLVVAILSNLEKECNFQPGQRDDDDDDGAGRRAI